MLQRAVARQLQRHFAGLLIDGHGEDVLAGIARHRAHLAVDDHERDVVFLAVHNGGQVIGLLGNRQTVAHVRHAVRAAVHGKQLGSIQRRRRLTDVMTVVGSIITEGFVHQQPRRRSRQTHLRGVVVHFHRERAFCRIARGVRHADGNFARQGLVRRRIVGAMRLGTGKLVTIVHRPGAVRTLRRAGHGHGNAVYRHHAARHIGAVAGHGHLPAAFTAHGDHAVFAVQLHRERTGAGNAVFRMLTGTSLKRAFVHHDVGVARFRSIHRHHGHVLIALDGDGQRRFRRIAVRIHDGVGELFRPCRTLRHVHTGIQLVGIGAVRVQRQRAVGAFQCAPDRTFRISVLDGGYRLFGGTVRTEHIVGQYVLTAVALLRRSFRKRGIVCMGRGHVVGDDHGHHAGTRGAVRIRYRDHKIVGYLVVALAAVFLRGLGKMIGIIQPPCIGVEARHFQIAFIGGNDGARKRAVVHHDAADDDGSHAVECLDGHIAGSIGARSLRSPQAAFLHPEHVAFGGSSGAPVVRIVGIVQHGNVVKIAGVAGRDDHRIIDVRRARGRADDFGIHIAAGPAHIKAAQTIQTVQKRSVHIVVETVAIALTGRPCGRTGGRHEVGLVHGHEEVFTRDLGAVHLEGRHIILGIGGVKVLKADGGAIFKAQQQIVAVAGQRGFAGGEIKDEMPFRRAGNVLCSIGSRLGKAYVGHITLL